MSRHPMARTSRLRRTIPLSLALAALLAVTMVALPAFAQSNTDPTTTHNVTPTLEDFPQDRECTDPDSTLVKDQFQDLTLTGTGSESITVTVDGELVTVTISWPSVDDGVGTYDITVDNGVISRWFGKDAEYLLWQWAPTTNGTNVGPVSSDTRLHTSVAPSGKYRDEISHVDMCLAPQPTGAIEIIKTDHEGNPHTALDGVEFTITDQDGVTVDIDVPETTTAGTFCVDELEFATYTVEETGNPEGFLPLDPITGVVVDTAGECPDDPSVSISVQNEAAPVDLTVTKLKLSHDGTDFVQTTVPLAGFEYTLFEGVDDTGTVVATSTTGSDGLTTFDTGILEVGTTYTVCETGVPAGEEGYWSDGGCEDPFTAELDTDVSLTFYNAPKADISVGFTDVTGYTSASIVCTDASGDTVGEAETISTATTTDNGDDITLDISQLDMGDYDCAIQIRNGSES